MASNFNFPGLPDDGRMSFVSTTESSAAGILTPQDLPDTLKRQLVLRPEVILNVYGASGSDGNRTPLAGPAAGPVAAPASSSVSSAILDLLAAVKELNKKVGEQQDHIASLDQLVVDQQSRILELEARQKREQQQQQQSPKLAIDCGTWVKTGTPWDCSHYDTYVAFSVRFASPPKVMAAINFADVSNERNLRLKVYTTEVTAEGFVLHTDDWGNSKTYACGATWFAVGTAAQ